MRRESCEIWVRTAAGKDPGIAFCKGTASLALQRAGEDCRPAAPGARVDGLIDEVDKIIWQSNVDLLAHPIMVTK